MITKFKNLYYCVFIFFFIFIINAQSQNINPDLTKAQKLYSEKKYNEAVTLFAKVYNKKKTSKIYSPYLDCLIKLSEFEKATKLVKSYYKKQGKNPSILIDLGELYILQGHEDLAKKEFENVIDEIRKKPNFITVQEYEKGGKNPWEEASIDPSEPPEHDTLKPL